MMENFLSIKTKKKKEHFLQHKEHKNTKRILHRRVEKYRKEASIHTAEMTAVKIELKEFYAKGEKYRQYIQTL